MDSGKMREEFEAWYGDTLKKQEADMPKYCVSTLRFSKEVLWEGWKARQESLVIELPEQFTAYVGVISAEDADGDQVMDAAEVRKAIEAAGLKPRQCATCRGSTVVWMVSDSVDYPHKGNCPACVQKVVFEK